MAIPFESVLEERGALPVHVELEVDECVPPEEFPGPAKLRGRVVRVFRGEVALETQLSIQLDVMLPGSSIPMGDFYYPWSGVRDARYVELFLERRGESLRVPYNSCTDLIERPSDVPRLAWSSRVPEPERASWMERALRWIARRRWRA